MVSLDDDNERRFKWREIGLIGVGALLILGAIGVFTLHSKEVPRSDLCRQAEPIVPVGNFRDSSGFYSPDYINHSARLLGGAVQIPTVSYDDMSHDVNEEPRFKVLEQFHKYLFDKFPLAAVYHEVVNTYGLLYTINGTDPLLAPVCLMAHQDVVPVNPTTEDQWEHPPFSGEYDGEYVYGRGAGDTKNSLVGTLEAVEALLSQGWEPKRTVILSFGFDEEIGGSRGAKQLASTIRERYGRDSLAVVVDEGTGVIDAGGSLFAAPSVAEKGRLDFTLVLHTPGGHSSIPPDHTGIGILSELVETLEANPFEPNLVEGGVVASFFECMGQYAPDLDSKTRNAYTHLDAKRFRYQVANELNKDPETRYMIRTSQAADIFRGGVKINALPELIELEVDHRIEVTSSLEFVSKRILGYAENLAKAFDLQLEMDGEKFTSGSYGTLNITSWNGLSPAPISPYSLSDDIWTVIAGTSKHVFEDVAELDTVYVAPMVMTANTDTAHYWDLTSHIYRYNPVLAKDVINIHTVDEKIRFRSHISSVAWYYEFLINMST